MDEVKKAVFLERMKAGREAAKGRPSVERRPDKRALALELKRARVELQEAAKLEVELRREIMALEHRVAVLLRECEEAVGRLV